jgi:aromatic ring-opening dioxygenase catalytic subunit (LigB family)
MAKFVGGFGVAHHPSFPSAIADAPGKLPDEAFYAAVKEQLEKAEPDVIIELSTDHFTNFYQSNLPTFCLGIFDQAEGPEPTQRMPHYTVTSDMPLARGLLSYGVKSDFDFASSEELLLDHSVMIPLHFLTPDMNIPVVPLYINGIAPPMPRPERCMELGLLLRRFIEEWDSNQRVALLASGAFAIDVGGPKMGWTDTDWVNTIRDHMVDAKYEQLAKLATPERVAEAGSASGEILNWMAVLGAVGEKRPSFVETNAGHGYAAWMME